MSLWSTDSSNTEITVWDESVVHILIQYRTYGTGCERVNHRVTLKCGQAFSHILDTYRLDRKD